MWLKLKAWFNGGSIEYTNAERALRMSESYRQHTEDSAALEASMKEQRADMDAAHARIGALRGGDGQ